MLDDSDPPDEDGEHPEHQAADERHGKRESQKHPVTPAVEPPGRRTVARPRCYSNGLTGRRARPLPSVAPAIAVERAYQRAAEEGE